MQVSEEKDDERDLQSIFQPALSSEHTQNPEFPHVMLLYGRRKESRPPSYPTTWLPPSSPPTAEVQNSPYFLPVCSLPHCVKPVQLPLPFLLSVTRLPELHSLSHLPRTKLSKTCLIPIPRVSDSAAQNHHMMEAVMCPS